MSPGIQIELTVPGALLIAQDEISQVGWSCQPILDRNLERAAYLLLPQGKLYAIFRLGENTAFRTFPL
jgi:hypothetical protein